MSSYCSQLQLHCPLLRGLRFRLMDPWMALLSYPRVQSEPESLTRSASKHVYGQIPRNIKSLQRDAINASRLNRHIKPYTCRPVVTGGAAGQPIAKPLTSPRARHLHCAWIPAVQLCRSSEVYTCINVPVQYIIFLLGAWLSAS